MGKIQRAISFALAFVMATTLSACGNKDKQSDKIKLSDIKKIEGIDLSTYVDFFREIEAKYALLKYYPTFEEIKEHEENTIEGITCQKDILLDSEAMFYQIKKNSNDVFIKTPGCASLFCVNSFDEDERELQEMFEKTLKKALDLVLLNATNDIKEDFHRISEMSFVINDGNKRLFANGEFYVNTNICYMYKDVLEKAKKEGTLEDTLFTIITRVLNYARELPCSCKEEQASEVSKTVSTFKTELAYPNNVLNETLTGAAADSYMYTFGGVNDIVSYDTFDYEHYCEREEEAALFLLAMLNDDAMLQDYYNAMFDNNLKGVHNFFGLETQADYESFYRILYSIDSSWSYSYLESNLLEDETYSSLYRSDLYRLIGSDYKVDYYSFALERLTDYTINHDIPLLENLTVFQLIKNATANISSLYLKIDGDVADQIMALSSKYEDFLSECYGISLDDVKAMGEDVSSMLHAIDVLCDDSRTKDSHDPYLAKAEALLNRFPMLRSINFTIPTIFRVDGYYSELEENMALVREKGEEE